jgi:predicted dehydrogenase
MDQDGQRSAQYASYYSVRKYDRLDDVLNDRNVELIINLTNPKNHFIVSKTCLDADKNVYSEKPLAMSFSEARNLVDLAQHKGLYIASAPSRLLAETAQTLWKALQEQAIGKVHAVYAEMDGCLIYRTRYEEWVNEVGMHWPYKDEFEVGCTIEHAGYPVSWLSAYFGPVETVTAFATCQIPEIQTQVGLNTVPPDLTIACLKFKSGVVARLTTSWIAPHDHSIRIFGDTGVLSTNDVWAPKSPVYITRNREIRIGPKTIAIPWKRKCPMLEHPGQAFSVRARQNVFRSPQAILRKIRARFLHLRKRVDFCLGPAEVAAALREGRPCRLSPEYCLHNTEIVLAIHNSKDSGTNYKVLTSFGPMEPFPWASTK